MRRSVRIYLDNCSLQRPLDDQSQVRIQLEAQAVLGILALSQQGQVELVNSGALQYEIARTPDPQRRLFATEALQSASINVQFTDALVKRAKELEQVGVKPLDALHVASAEDAEAQYFCTSDDRLRKRLQAISSLSVTVVTPLELIQEVLP